jgi:flagellar biosynthesis protein FlhG
LARVITLGSGKGGTGKSFLAANLGLALAHAGVRTTLVDLDLGCADLHLMLGVLSPQRGLLAVLRGEVAAMQDVAMPVAGHPLLSLVPGTVETLRMSGLTAAEIVQLAHGLRQLDAEVVVVDLPGGVTPQVLDLFLVGDQQVIVATPDPVSLADARRLLSLARVRRSTHGQRGRSPRRPRVYTSLDDLVRDMNTLREETAVERGALCPALVLNRCRPGGGVSTEQQLHSLAQQLDGLELPLLAEVPDDPQVESSMRMLQPLFALAPGAPAAEVLTRLAQRIAAELRRAAAGSGPTLVRETVGV